MKTIKELEIAGHTKIYKNGYNQARKDVLGLIDERLKAAFKRLEFCRTHKTTYYRNEEMRALSIIDELQELKNH